MFNLIIHSACTYLFILEVSQKEAPEISCPELLRILLKTHRIVRNPIRLYIPGEQDSVYFWEA